MLNADSHSSLATLRAFPGQRVGVVEHLPLIMTGVMLGVAVHRGKKNKVATQTAQLVLRWCE